VPLGGLRQLLDKLGQAAIIVPSQAVELIPLRWVGPDIFPGTLVPPCPSPQKRISWRYWDMRAERFGEVSAVANPACAVRY
jgi:hypothetical protein